MTATFEGAQYSRLDPVTLAAFEDSGWYQVNYSAAEQLLWGQGKRQERSATQHLQPKSALGQDTVWSYSLLRCNSNC